MKPVTFAAILVTVLLSGCKIKKEIQPVNNLLVNVDMQLLDYTQTFNKDSSGFYQLGTTSSTIGVRLQGSFLSEQTTAVKDSTLPDQSKGYYARVRFTAPDTLEEQYNSEVAGKPMKSHLKCPVTFAKGTLENLKNGQKVELSYTESAIAEQKAMYITQLEREYTPLVTEMMWKEIERLNSRKLTPEEVRQHYRIMVTDKAQIVEMSKAAIKMDGKTAEITYPGRLYFTLQFSGRVEIIK